MCPCLSLLNSHFSKTSLISLHVHSQPFVISLSFSQLCGEYREQVGNFARREATRLLTENQSNKHAGNARAIRRGYGRTHHISLETGPMTPGFNHSSSIKKPQPYSKCQGEEYLMSYLSYIQVSR